MVQVYILSITKSGTHLISNILQCLDIKRYSLDKVYRVYDENDRLPVKLASGIDSFNIAHAICSDNNIQALSGIKKILPVRGILEIKESVRRALKETGEDFSNDISIDNIKNIMKWKYEDDVFCIKFKDVINKNTSIIDDLQFFLFGEIKKNSLEVIDCAIKMDSYSKSSLRKN